MISIGERRPDIRCQPGRIDQTPDPVMRVENKPHSEQGLPGVQLLGRGVTYVANNLDRAGH
jgi:hypothetical protein